MESCRHGVGKAEAVRKLWAEAGRGRWWRLVFMGHRQAASPACLGPGRAGGPGGRAQGPVTSGMKHPHAPSVSPHVWGLCVSCVRASRHVHVFVWAPCVIWAGAPAALPSAQGLPSPSQGRACLCASRPHVYPCPFCAPVPRTVSPPARISGHSPLVLVCADTGGRDVPCALTRFSPL